MHFQALAFLRSNCNYNTGRFSMALPLVATGKFSHAKRRLRSAWYWGTGHRDLDSGCIFKDKNYLDRKR